MILKIDAQATIGIRAQSYANCLTPQQVTLCFLTPRHHIRSPARHHHATPHRCTTPSLPTAPRRKYQRTATATCAAEPYVTKTVNWDNNPREEICVTQCTCDASLDWCDSQDRCAAYEWDQESNICRLFAAITGDPWLQLPYRATRRDAAPRDAKPLHSVPVSLARNDKCVQMQ